MVIFRVVCCCVFVCQCTGSIDVLRVTYLLAVGLTAGRGTEGVCAQSVPSSSPKGGWETLVFASHSKCVGFPLLL